MLGMGRSKSISWMSADKAFQHQKSESELSFSDGHK